MKNKLLFLLIAISCLNSCTLGDSERLAIENHELSTGFSTAIGGDEVNHSHQDKPSTVSAKIIHDFNENKSILVGDHESIFDQTIIIDSGISLTNKIHIFYADSEKILYGITDNAFSQSITKSIYEFEFKSNETKLIYSFDDNQAYSIDRIVKNGDDYYASCFDPLLDSLGYFNYYILKIGDQDANITYSMKAKFLWTLPFHLQRSGEVGNGLFQIKSGSDIENLHYDFDSDTFYVDEVSDINHNGMLHATLYQKRDGAEVFVITENERHIAHYRVNDKTHTIEVDTPPSVGLLGNKLIIADNSNRTVNVYDESMKLINSIETGKIVYMLYSVDSQMTYCQFSGDAELVGFIFNDGGQLSLHLMKIDSYNFPTIEQKGFTIAYTINEESLTQSKEKHYNSENYHIKIHNVNRLP